MKKIIAPYVELRKYFTESSLNFLTSVTQRHIQEKILAMAQKGHIGKMQDFCELGAAHRTTYGHFLSKGKKYSRKLTPNIEIDKCGKIDYTYKRVGQTAAGVCRKAAREESPGSTGQE